MHVTRVFPYVLPLILERGGVVTKTDQVWWRWECSCGDSAERHQSMASHEDLAEQQAATHIEIECR